MNAKRYIIAAAATVGTGALFFGGTAVSTSFSSETTGNVHTAGQAITLSTPRSMSLSVSDLVPGVTKQAGSFELKTGQNGGNLSLSDVNWQVITNGSNGAAPNPAELTVSIVDAARSQTPVFTRTLDQLLHTSTPIMNGVPGNVDETLTVLVTLANTASNEWNGAAADAPFTLHLQNAGS
ncbi:MAG TPA: hypothetical protein VGN28_12835 [Blastococcus sp.]|jgi:hypothetical protein|nr:hypothetical protein [Blastococcus sp.]